MSITSKIVSIGLAITLAAVAGRVLSPQSTIQNLQPLLLPSPNGGRIVYPDGFVPENFTWCMQATADLAIDFTDIPPVLDGDTLVVPPPDGNCFYRLKGVTNASAIPTNHVLSVTLIVPRLAPFKK